MAFNINKNVLASPAETQTYYNTKKEQCSRPGSSVCRLHVAGSADSHTTRKGARLHCIQAKKLSM